MSVISNNYQAQIYKINDLSNLKISYRKPNLYNKTLEITKAYIRDNDSNIPNETIYFQLSNILLKNIDEEKNMLLFESNDKELFSFFQNLDKCNITTLYNKRESWFEDEEDNDVLEFEDIVESYKKIYRNWDDESQTFMFKSFYNNNEIPIFNSFRERLEFENLNENDDLTLILEYIGIRFDEDDFFPLFLIKQIKLNEQKSLNFDDYQFNESDFDEDEEDEDEEVENTNTEENIETEENAETEENSNNVENVETEEITENKNIKEVSQNNIEVNQGKKKKLKARLQGIKLKEL